MRNVKMSFQDLKKKYTGPRISFDKSPLGWERLPTPVFCPGEFHGLYMYSPWGLGVGHN